MARVKQSKTEIENQLKEQIGFLITSCKLYDDGHSAEAKRLAGTLRILLHEKKKSRSLLGQLHLRDILWVDTAVPYDHENLVSQVGLVTIQFDGPSGRIPWLSPKGLPAGDLKKSEFNKWWSHPVIIAVTSTEKKFFSRQYLILNVAETDGGAHVDPDLEAVYAELSRKNIVGFTTIKDGKRYPMLYPEMPCLRQIAHEVLLTLQEMVPKYFSETYGSEIREKPCVGDHGSQPGPSSVEIYIRQKSTEGVDAVHRL